MVISYIKYNFCPKFQKLIGKMFESKNKKNKKKSKLNLSGLKAELIVKTTVL